MPPLQGAGPKGRGLFVQSHCIVLSHRVARWNLSPVFILLVKLLIGATPTASRSPLERGHEGVFKIRGTTMLRLATKSDLPGIVTLWQEAFGDSPEAVSYFFQSFPGCLSYVAEEEGEVISMVHALPQTLSPDTSAAYVYAVATLRSHRGKGLCRDLMAFAEQDLSSRGFSCAVLTPGELGLFDYYERLGYSIAFTRRRVKFSGGTELTLSQYLSKREQLLQEPHMAYDRNTLSYAADVYGLSFYETNTGIAAAGPRYTAEVLPEDTEGDRFAYGMIKCLGEAREWNNAYLGFALE